jgi:hypothetical protein
MLAEASCSSIAGTSVDVAGVSDMTSCVIGADAFRDALREALRFGAARFFGAAAFFAAFLRGAAFFATFFFVAFLLLLRAPVLRAPVPRFATFFTLFLAFFLLVLPAFFLAFFLLAIVHLQVSPTTQDSGGFAGFDYYTQREPSCIISL